MIVWWPPSSDNLFLVLSSLLKNIEAIQTGCDDDPLVYVRMSCWERILLVLSKLSEGKHCSAACELFDWRVVSHRIVL